MLLLLFIFILFLLFFCFFIHFLLFYSTFFFSFLLSLSLVLCFLSRVLFLGFYINIIEEKKVHNNENRYSILKCNLISFFHIHVYIVYLNVQQFDFILFFLFFLFAKLHDLKWTHVWNSNLRNIIIELYAKKKKKSSSVLLLLL